jgi:hypothetical protein
VADSDNAAYPAEGGADTVKDNAAPAGSLDDPEQRAGEDTVAGAETATTSPAPSLRELFDAAVEALGAPGHGYSYSSRDEQGNELGERALLYDVDGLARSLNRKAAEDSSADGEQQLRGLARSLTIAAAEAWPPDDGSGIRDAVPYDEPEALRLLADRFDVPPSQMYDVIDKLGGTAEETLSLLDDDIRDMPAGNDDVGPSPEDRIRAAIEEIEGQ